MRPLARYASPQLADEARRRDRVAAGVRLVDAARRERAAPDDRLRRRRLDGVVGRGEQREIGGGRRAGAVEVELRQPEAVQVRLVADDQVAEARVRLARSPRRTRRTPPAPRASAASCASRRGRRRRRRGRRAGLPRRRRCRAPRPRARSERSGPAAQVLVIRTARKPASRTRPMSASASTSVGARTASSAAPSDDRRAAGVGRRDERECRKGCEEALQAVAKVAGVADVREKLKGLPAKPGVYLFRDEQGEVLYVGKAKSLRPRVRSYFQGAAATSARRSRGSSAHRRPRGDRDVDRGRGAPPRAEPRQAPPAALQRAPARRQVVPVHRRHGRGRVPARDVHPRAAPPRRPLLRAVREREEGARDARRAQPRLPVPAVRRAEAGAPLRDPVPRLPHRALPRAVRRLHLEGRVRGDHRRRDQLPLRRHAHDRARAAAADARGGRRRALRGCGALPEPALRDREPRRAAGGGPARDRLDRRPRRRRRRATAPRCRSSRSAAAR